MRRGVQADELGAVGEAADAHWVGQRHHPRHRDRDRAVARAHVGGQHALQPVLDQRAPLPEKAERTLENLRTVGDLDGVRVRRGGIDAAARERRRQRARGAAAQLHF